MKCKVSSFVHIRIYSKMGLNSVPLYTHIIDLISNDHKKRIVSQMARGDLPLLSSSNA
jgi:hypothetical protein